MLPTGPAVEKTGLALSRVIVPLWVLTGAVVKLMAGSPNNLPQNFVDFGRDAGINLGHMLYTLIGLEIFAVAVMVLLARFARPMAIFMLSVFCLVLIGEMARGEQSCGCFGGGVEVQPWQMLLIDAILLVGVILFRPKVPESAMGLSKAAPIAAALAVGGLAVSFAGAAILHQDQAQETEVVDDGEESDPTINPNPRSLPRFWYTENLDSWRGQPWREVDIFRFMRRWPADMDEGTRYVVFFSPTCEHCRDMFIDDLSQPLDAPVIAVQIPYSDRQLTGPNPLFDPAEYTGMQHLALPVGPDWIITAPLALRIENGIITCVQESDHKQCLGLE